MNDATEPTTSGETTGTEEQTAGVSTKAARCLRIVRGMKEDGLGHVQNI